MSVLMFMDRQRCLAITLVLIHKDRMVVREIHRYHAHWFQIAGERPG